MMDMITLERELKVADRVLQRLERELWIAAPAFERFQKSVGPDPDNIDNNKDRVKEGIGRACDELRQMFKDIYWPDKKIPF
jgi:hypothetical protein